MRLLWHEKAWEDYNGWWSRRIDETNRIVYFWKDNVIYVISCRGHYED